jgi:hypothetical protein
MSPANAYPQIDAEALEWKDSSFDSNFPRHRLLAQCSIAGCPMHLEAHEVRTDNDCQEAVGSGSELLYHLEQISGGDGPWITTTIEGKEYIIIATPHRD